MDLSDAQAANCVKPFTYSFTVFTPTYNRAHTLDRVFQSLCAQTCREFEWLIVDDGSSDNTRELVADWQRSANFPIRYVFQENGGKHSAHNAAIQLARGELFLTLDSDDACVPEALERLKFNWDCIPLRDREHFTGVTVSCVDEARNLIGSRFPRDVTDSDSIEIRYKYKVRGEKWGFQRTAVLREFPFPRPDAGRFLPEDIVWKAIARHYKTRYVNETLRIYYEADADQGARLSRDSLKKHAVGRRLQNLLQLNHDLRWMRYAPVEFLRIAGNYARASFHCGFGLDAQRQALNTAVAKALWIAMLPIGYLYYWRDCSTGTIGSATSGVGGDAVPPPDHPLAR